ncbi:hypothetical protein O4H61_06450 [Roseovarius aestuarii]|nr:hypothetical protein [Roseovarius aestuarii]
MPSADRTNSSPNTDQAQSHAPMSENAVATYIILAVVAALLAWGAAIFVWGVPGLYIPALALVPVVWVCLLLISFGR